jgi:pimeloyl-ACP methyl ester carboxylesterase
VPDLPGIDVPTLVITGTADRLIPPDVTAGIAGLVPGAELLRIEGAGHLSNLEAPEAFDTAVQGVVTLIGP